MLSQICTDIDHASGARAHPTPTHTHTHTHTLTEANQTFDERDIMATWPLDEHRTVVKPNSVPVKSREKSFALPGLPARTERRPPPSRRFHSHMDICT